MKLTSALGLFLLVSGLVFAEKLDECQELQSYLHGRFREGHSSCESNEDGKITKLSIEDFVMTKEDFMKIQSYGTITSLSYVYYDWYGDTHYRVPDFNYFTNLQNLKNLERLSISYYVYKNPCSNLCHIHFLKAIGKDTFKGLKNLKELNVFGMKLTQDNIDEISTLENIESLSLNYCSFENVKDYSSLSNLKKVKYLSATQNDNGYENSSSKTVPCEFVNSFENVDVINVDNCPCVNYKQFTNVETLNVDREDDTSFLKYFKNLKNLTIKPYNDLSVLEYVDSLEILTISYEPSSHGYAEFPYVSMNLKLSENSNISYLILHGVKITDENLAEIFTLKNLKYISFEYCKFLLSDENIEILRSLKSLCPFQVKYSVCYFNDMYDTTERDFKNENCSNITSITTLKKPVPPPKPIDPPSEIPKPIDPEPTKIYEPIDPEPTKTSDPVDPPSDISDPEDPPSDFSEPEDPEPSEIPKLIDPVPSEIFDPVYPEPTESFEPLYPEPTESFEPLYPEPTESFEPLYLEPTESFEPLYPEPTESFELEDLPSEYSEQEDPLFKFSKLEDPPSEFSKLEDQLSEFSEPENPEPSEIPRLVDPVPTKTFDPVDPEPTEFSEPEELPSEYSDYEDYSKSDDTIQNIKQFRKRDYIKNNY